MISGENPEYIKTLEEYICVHKPCCNHCIHNNPTMMYAETAFATSILASQSHPVQPIIADVLDKLYDDLWSRNNHLQSSPMYVLQNPLETKEFNLFFIHIYSSSIRLASSGWKYWKVTGKMPCWFRDAHRPSRIAHIRSLSLTHDSSTTTCTAIHESRTCQTIFVPSDNDSERIFRIFFTPSIGKHEIYLHKYFGKIVKKENIIDMTKEFNMHDMTREAMTSIPVRCNEEVIPTPVTQFLHGKRIENRESVNHNDDVKKDEKIVQNPGPGGFSLNELLLKRTKMLGAIDDKD